MFFQRFTNGLDRFHKSLLHIKFLQGDGCQVFNGVGRHAFHLAEVGSGVFALSKDKQKGVVGLQVCCNTFKVEGV